MTARLPDPARSRIVIIGSPHYEDPRLPDVPVISNNVRDLARLLTDPQVGMFPPRHCVTAPPTADIATVGKLLTTAASEAEDLLLVYYAGHGLLGRRRGELYLTVAGTRQDELAFTALPFEAVRDACLDSPAKNRVVILDCCYSGRAIGETLADTGTQVMGQVEVKGTYTLTASPANRTALVLDGEAHTAFTGRLLRLLQEGVPGGAGPLSLGAIYRQLLAMSSREGLPLPQQRGTDTADLLGLVRNRGHSVAQSDGAASAFEERLLSRLQEAIRIGKSGNEVEARRLLRAVAIDRERLSGTEHPATLSAQFQHARWVGRAGDRREAARLLRDVVADQVRVLGPEHPDTLASRAFLAFNAGEAGDWVEEVGRLQLVVSDQARLLGADHPDTLTSRDLAAIGTSQTGDMAEAAKLHRQLIADRTRVLGPDHLDTLDSRCSYADLLRITGELGESIPLFEQLLPDLERVGGLDNPSLLWARRNLAAAIGAAGDSEQAARRLRALVGDMSRVLGADHRDTLSARYELAERSTDLDEQVQLLGQLVADQTRVLGADHTSTMWSRRLHVAVVADRQENEKAVRFGRELLADEERLYGVDHPQVLAMRYLIVVKLGDSGDRAEASRLLPRLVLDMSRVLGADHADTRQALALLRSYEQQ